MMKVVARDKLQLCAELIGMDSRWRLPKLFSPTVGGGELWSPTVDGLSKKEKKETKVTNHI